jgi:hypothetical protein
MGLEAVVADQQHGKAAAGSGKRLHVERVALAVGDEQEIACLGVGENARERKADFGAAVGAGKLSREVRERSLAVRADMPQPGIELPQIDRVSAPDLAPQLSIAARAASCLVMAPLCIARQRSAIEPEWSTIMAMSSAASPTAEGATVSATLLPSAATPLSSRAEKPTTSMSMGALRATSAFRSSSRPPMRVAFPSRQSRVSVPLCCGPP